MSKNRMGAALVAACVLAVATPVSHAHQTGSIGAEQSEFTLYGFLISLYESLFCGPEGPRPPPG